MTPTDLNAFWGFWTESCGVVLHTTGLSSNRSPFDLLTLIDTNIPFPNLKFKTKPKVLSSGNLVGVGANVDDFVPFARSLSRALFNV